MALPMWIFLIPYALVVCMTSLYVFFNVYHLAKFGVAKRGTGTMIALYLIGYFLLIALSAFVLLAFDWTSGISPSDLINAPGL